MSALAWRDFDPARFLRDHWQKTPLLIRNAWQDWTNPLSPDELAGLACEAELESRLIVQPAPGQWTLEHGPLKPDRFAALGSEPWTLLVQAVDQHVPEVAALLEPFRFLPNWRIDDVMVSYASDGGGVGPHFDQYDVFLVQGLGQRRWRIGPRCDDTSALIPHEGLILLAEFAPTDEWVLEAGDILYLPPGFAHDGIAVGDECMTYSIGFRAPSRGELVSSWADHVLDTLDEDDRYCDGPLKPATNPGEIGPAALDRVNRMIAETLAQGEDFARWFGQFVTAPKSDRLEWAPDDALSAEDVRETLAEGGAIERNPAGRYAFTIQSPDTVTLFVDGDAWTCEGPSATFATELCARTAFAIDPAWATSPSVADLILDLVNRGAIALVAEADRSDPAP